MADDGPKWLPMADREFDCFVARPPWIQDKPDPSSVEPDLRKFLLSTSQADSMSGPVVGVPICGEHDEGVAVGRVVSSRRLPSGDWEAKFRMDTGAIAGQTPRQNVLAAQTAAAYIDLGYLTDVSLQHNPNGDIPIELTLCQVAARSGAKITSGRMPLPEDESITRFYKAEWQRVKASRRIKAAAGSSRSPHIIDARLDPDEKTPNILAAATAATTTMNGAAIPGLPGVMMSPLPGTGAFASSLLNQMRSLDQPPPSAAQPPSPPSSSSPPAAATEGKDAPPSSLSSSTSRAPTMLTSPPAPSPPPAHATDAPSVATPAPDPSKGHTDAPSTSAPGDHTTSLHSRLADLAGSHKIPSKSERMGIVADATGVLTEVVQSRAEIAALKEKLAAAERMRQDAERLAETAAEARKRNEESGLVPRGTSAAIQRDIENGSVESARRRASEMSIAAAAASREEAEHRLTIENFNNLYGLLTHKVQPQSAAMLGGSTRTPLHGYGAAAAAASPAPTIAASAGAPTGGGGGTFYQMINGVMYEMKSMAVAPTAPAAAADTFAPHRPAESAIAASGRRPLRREPLAMPGEGLMGESGLPIGRMCIADRPIEGMVKASRTAERYVGSIHGRTRAATIAASAPGYAARPDGTREWFDPDEMMRNRTPIETFDPNKDRSAECGWSVRASGIGKALHAVTENLGKVDIPPPEYVEHFLNPAGALWQTLTNPMYGTNDARGSAYRALPRSRGMSSLGKHGMA